MKQPLSSTDRIALLISLLAAVITYSIHNHILEGMAHLEDEMAYVWQAQIIAHGQLTVPSPLSPKSFLVPFVVDYHGQRFAKYPPGWPVVLAIGERFGGRDIVNPILAGFGVWLTYLIGKRLFSELVAVIAAGLTLTSPFFLMNSASLLSHPLGLVLSAAFVLGWLDAFSADEMQNRWLPTVAAGAALGLLGLTRPFSALAVSLPMAIHGLYRYIHHPADRPRLLTLGLIAAGVGSLYFVWQYAVTGDLFLNPYTLWWPYDKIGFGPGVGRIPGGHTLNQAWVNTRFNIHVGRFDLFGWAGYSLVFLPFGILALLRDRNWRALLPLGVFCSLFILYFAYWIGAWVFGPRYYYEGLFALTLLSALGIAWLAGWPTLPRQPVQNYIGARKVATLVVTAIVGLLVAMNLIFYTPPRLEMLRGLYGVRRSSLEPFLTPGAQQLTPALVIVHTQKSWIEYGTLLELENPFLDSPFIFIFSRSKQEDALASSDFPNRAIFHYYPYDNPFVFYHSPKTTN